MESVKNEFLAKIDSILGLYLDSFYANLIYRSKMKEVLKKESPKFVLNMHDSDPLLPETKTLHTVTKKELLERIEIDGSNVLALGNTSLVMIYQFWEDEFRLRIAKSKNVSKNEIKSDLFGEVRILRQAIIHNNSNVNSDFRKVQNIYYTKTESGKFGFKNKQFEKLVNDIKIEVKGL